MTSVCVQTNVKIWNTSYYKYQERVILKYIVKETQCFVYSLLIEYVTAEKFTET